MRRSVACNIAALLLAPGFTVAQQPASRPAPLKRGMVITSSMKFARREYRITGATTLDSAIIVIRGDHIVLDLNGATLDGVGAAADPDQARGVGILVDGGTDVTIKNGAIRGYRVNVLARGTAKLTLADLDVGHSWKPRLYSLKEHESLVDWLSFHHNEHGEWLRFGAGMYLDGVSGGEISGVRAEQGMNGLMLVKSDHLFIHDDAFQFNSGLGAGLYRSSDNRIIHNRIDFNVRGYSDGVYWRGQDSADLLFFEQSSRNIVAYNSATHGGDGFFLWAGQSTMDSGEGGANDNILYRNDFSFAPANAIEATFSRNVFLSNRAAGSDYGLWGGYSYESKIVGNCFSGSRIGVAIEHGQDNLIGANRFDYNTIGIKLWADPIAPSDWGYPKHRDTGSRHVQIDSNLLYLDALGVSIANTRGVLLANNTWVSVDTLVAYRDTADLREGDTHITYRTGGTLRDSCDYMPSIPAEFSRLAPAPDGTSREIPASPLAQRDRSAIIVDEWGPYDWSAPKLWPVDSTHAAPLRLAVLGPEGSWRVTSRRGVAKISATSGRMNDTIMVMPAGASRGDWAITMESRAKGRAPQRFSYAIFEPTQDWQLRAFAWADSADPRTKPAAFAALLAGTPLMNARASRLDYEWYRPKVAALPLERWALEATTRVELAAGRYTLRTISDDGIRVWVDGKLVIDDWTAHESAVDVAALSGGSHELRVEYYQVDGWTELRLDILRGAQRAGGSPGPH